MRTFDSGATRNEDNARPDYEGFLSPLVLERFGEYMSKHRVQKDGQLRDSDNWQKGIPLSVYMKGAFRHLLHWWQRHRGFSVRDPLAAEDLEEDICALIFNAQGYLHELLIARGLVQFAPPPVIFPAPVKLDRTWNSATGSEKIHDGDDNF